MSQSETFLWYTPIPNFGNRWVSVVSFTSRPFFTRKEFQVPTEQEACGPNCQAGRYGEEKSSSPYRDSNPGASTRNLGTVPITVCMRSVMLCLVCWFQCCGRSCCLHLQDGRDQCTRPAFLKLWSADHKWSSGSSLVVLLD
jgi:hypothetical protein